MTILVNHPISASDMDHSVSPKDSFYHHVNGIWLKETSIPAEFSRWGAFTVLAEEAKAALKIIFDESSQKPNESILGFLYNAAMDTEAIESAGITGVEVLLTQVQAIETVHDLVNVIAKIQTELSSAIFFSHGPEPDSKNSDMVILSMGQGGLGLPDRDYYFDESKSDIRTKYIEHIATVFKLLNVDQLTCTSNAEAVFNFEKQIAEFSLKREDRRDPIKAYNKVNLAELRELASEFNWNAFFEAIGLGLDFGPIILERKEYFSSLIELITKTQPQIIKHYLTFHIIKESSPKLSEKFVNEHFKFYETTLKGTQQLQPLWKRRIDQVCGMIQDIVSQEYVKRNFSEESKAMALELVEFIIVAFKERIQEIEWMCAETKTRALQKLNSFRVKIGYPDKWIDYTQLGNIRNCKSFIEMSRLANKFNHDHEYKEINQKTDRLKWMMPPFMVNAYFHPMLNEIVFPAAILQPPFFYPPTPEYPLGNPALSFGGIGAVIAHEISHGYDDQGRQYDHEGNLNDWWTPTDSENYLERTKLIIEQFDSYQLLGQHVNGKLTQGENIADLGGVSVSYKAFMKYLQAHDLPPHKDYSQQQLFFINFARIWRNLARDEAAKQLLTVDPHSPGEFRANGTLSNLVEFYELFGVKEGDGMYRSEDKQVSIW